MPFTGHHEAIARIFDAWAPGAVTNADMSPSTRLTSQEAPDQLRNDYRIEVALGMISAREDSDVDAAGRSSTTRLSAPAWPTQRPPSWNRAAAKTPNERRRRLMVLSCRDPGTGPP
jgi:hypothetical protein